jgi:hypothetical protein
VQVVDEDRQRLPIRTRMDARSMSLRTASNMRVRSESLVAERDKRRHPQPIEQPLRCSRPAALYRARNIGRAHALPSQPRALARDRNNLHRTSRGSPETHAADA